MKERSATSATMTVRRFQPQLRASRWLGGWNIAMMEMYCSSVMLICLLDVQ